MGESLYVFLNLFSFLSHGNFDLILNFTTLIITSWHCKKNNKMFGLFSHYVQSKFNYWVALLSLEVQHNRWVIK